MSTLINNYSSANRVVDSSLAVVYSKMRVYGQWSYESGPGQTTTKTEAWSYMRTANKSYRYVGMTKDAAEQCADDMRSLYQRNVMSSVFSETLHEFTDESSGNLPMADVSVQHFAGGMWDVIINVHETDARMRFASVGANTLFSAEDNRDYDED